VHRLAVRGRGAPGGRVGRAPGRPAETISLRDPKRRAKTDRADARLLRELLEQGRLPRSWIPPTWILDLRTTVRLRKTLVDQRTAWQQPIHAVLFHHGLPRPTQALLAGSSRGWLEQVVLPPASRQLLGVALGQIDGLDAELDPIDRWLGALAHRQPGCRALMTGHYGIGSITAPTILAELGDARRFVGGDQVVRATGLDITVYDASDGRRSPGQLSRQGPEVLRWALFEAAKAAARPSSPDYAYYQQVKARQGGNRATLAVRASSPGGCAWARSRSPRSRTCPWRRWPDRDGWCVPCPLASRCAVASARGAPVATADPWMASKDRAAAHSRGTPHRSSCRRILAWSAHPDKAGRPHAHAAHRHHGEEVNSLR
jgi:transposase